MKKLGPGIMDTNITVLTKSVRALLEKKTRCFGNEDGDDDFE